MASFALDSQLHAIGRHLLRVAAAGGDVRAEIRDINDRHCLVPEQQCRAFEHDAYRAYEFERDRQLSISHLRTIGWARFALDSHLQRSELEASRRSLDDGLSGI